MSFYRSLIAVVAAMGLASLVFADDNTTTQGTTDTTQATQQTMADQNTQTTEKVNVNTATAKDLMKVKGLNSAKAKAIVSYRKKHGDFKSLDDLKQVKALKRLDNETMQQIQDQLTTG